MIGTEFPAQWWSERREPFFVYSPERVRENLAYLRARLKPQLKDAPRIYLSLKANSNARLLRSLDGAVDGFDCSSPIELESLLRANVSAGRITVSGPGKTDEFLKQIAALSPHAVHIDNADEFAVLEKAGYLKSGRWTLRHRGLTNAVKLGMSSAEIEKLLARAAPGSWSGLHAYLGRESFGPQAINSLLEELKAVALKHANFRSPDFALYLGLGLPQRDLIPDTDAYWNLPALKNFPFPVHFEGGRFFLMDAGVYGTPVLTVKRRVQERGVAVIDGGLQHLNGPLVAPLGARREVRHAVFRGGKILGGPTGEYQTFGSLCLANDVLHTHLPLPEDLGRGDWILFEAFGAYGITASVHSFIGQTPASEWLFDGGKMIAASPAQYKPYQLSF